MITIESYEEYFKNLSTKYQASGFYPIDMAEFKQFEENVRSNKISSPALVLEDFAIKGTASNNDQIRDVVLGAMLWLYKTSPRGNKDEIQLQLKKQAFSKIQLIKSQLIKDHKNYESLMFWLQIPDFEIDFTSPFPEWIGYRMQFVLHVPIE